MSSFQYDQDLRVQSSPQPGPVRLDEAQRYCRSLAKGHYENFVVGSILVPRKLMQNTYNLYAFCRHSDDLADETGDPSLSLELLREWREDLRRCYSGSPRHPILIALRTTINTFEIPIEPFEDLLSAFEQDCRVTRYGSYLDLLDYCRRSANPVGRLFLWLFGYKDIERCELSDRICTGLQLANFWQDVASDFARGRVYIPREDMEAYGCTESEIADRNLTPSFAELMKFEVERTEEVFRSGAALPAMLDSRLGMDVELFRRAGLALLGAIRKINYDVLAHRPTLSKVEKAGLLLGCVLRRP